MDETDADNDDAADEFSDISDDSDIFHIECLQDAPWKTEQDLELERAEAIAKKLRTRPLLPPDPENPHADWEDVASGNKFPLVHCAFKGCAWVFGMTENRIKSQQKSFIATPAICLW